MDLSNFLELPPLELDSDEVSADNGQLDSLSQVPSINTDRSSTEQRMENEELPNYTLETGIEEYPWPCYEQDPDMELDIEEMGGEWIGIANATEMEDEAMPYITHENVGLEYPIWNNQTPNVSYSGQEPNASGNHGSYRELQPTEYDSTGPIFYPAEYNQSGVTGPVDSSGEFGSLIQYNPIYEENPQTTSNPVETEPCHEPAVSSQMFALHARPSMTRAFLDCIKPNTCPMDQVLFYWFGLPILEQDLSYCSNIPGGYYMSLKDVQCSEGSKTDAFIYESNKSRKPVQINIVKAKRPGPVSMNMDLKSKLGAYGGVCQDIPCLEYILSVFASPLFRGEYFHVITGIYLREREEDEADVYSLEKPKDPLDRRRHVTKSENKVIIPYQPQENPAQIYTKTFFAPVLVREGEKSVLCILSICFERPPLKKDEIRPDMSDAKKNELYDIAHRAQKLVSATLIQFDDIEKETTSNWLNPYERIRSKLHGTIKYSEMYKNAKKYFDSIVLDKEANKGHPVENPSSSKSMDSSENKSTPGKENLVLVPEESAESHFFIRPDPENIERRHMFHGYNRDLETYVLVLKKKQNDTRDTDGPDTRAFMFLNPGKQLDLTPLGLMKMKEQSLEKNLWDIYTEIWEAGQVDEPPKRPWITAQQSYYIPDWWKYYPGIHDTKADRYKKERAKRYWELLRKRSEKRRKGGNIAGRRGYSRGGSS